MLVRSLKRNIEIALSSGEGMTANVGYSPPMALQDHDQEPDEDSKTAIDLARLAIEYDLRFAVGHTALAFVNRDECAPMIKSLRNSGMPE